MSFVHVALNRVDMLCGDRLCPSSKPKPPNGRRRISNNMPPHRIPLLNKLRNGLEKTAIRVPPKSKPPSMRAPTARQHKSRPMKHLAIALVLGGSVFAAHAQSPSPSAIAQQWVMDFNAAMATLGKPSGYDYTYQGEQPSSMPGWSDYYATSASGAKQIIVHVPDASGQLQVVFIGDSITQWLPWLTQFPQMSWANMGIAGNTCPEMAARFQADVVAAKPQTVVIACGTMDSYEIGDVHPSIASISSMVGQARAAGILVIVATAPPVTSAHPSLARYIRTFNRLLRLRGYFIWERWFPLVDGTDGYASSQYYEADGVHPLVGAGPDVMVGGNLRWMLSLVQAVTP
jgi:GDSL-like Lipase/Acylhydrolase family